MKIIVNRHAQERMLERWGWDKDNIKKNLIWVLKKGKRIGKASDSLLIQDGGYFVVLHREDERGQEWTVATVTIGTPPISWGYKNKIYSFANSPIRGRANLILED